MVYTQAQWLLIFFIYCVLGWMWESCYVSIKNHEWVNRGFLYGPWLPIYGSGAIIILFLTLPVGESPALIFPLGMAGATLLEYVTGAVMERIFHMRYWDYSDQPFNVNGHICLKVSLAWGVFSILLVKALHPPVERLVLLLPIWAADLIGLFLTILFVVDAVKSTQAALDMKALLQRLSDQSEKLREVESRLNTVVEQMENRSEAFRDKLLEMENAFAAKKEQLQRERKERAQIRANRVLEMLDQRRNHESRVLSFLWSKADAAMDEISLHLRGDIPGQERGRLESLESAIADFKRSIRNMQTDLAARKDRDYQRAISILERNPSAVSGKHREAFAELINLKKAKDPGDTRDDHVSK